MMLLAAILVLHPVLAEDGAVRVAATGVGEHDVAWLLDGVEVARTGEREAAVLQVAAGEHELRAVSVAQGRWVAVARPDGASQGAAFVPAWTATHEPPGASDASPGGGGLRLPPLSLGLGLVALVLLAWPSRLGWRGRSGLEALRRLRRR